MLFIKKIETAQEFEYVKQLDSKADERIWVLLNNSKTGKPFFTPMVPVDESELKNVLFFFKNKKDTVWKGGYYISKNEFDLTFDGTIRHEDSPKPLLTTLGVHVLGLDVNQDMTELASWLAGKNELTTEEINAKLADRKKAFFADLERRLYQPGYREEVTAAPDMLMQIRKLAADCMLKAFPWLNVEITFHIAVSSHTVCIGGVGIGNANLVAHLNLNTCYRIIVLVHNLNNEIRHLAKNYGSITVIVEDNVLIKLCALISAGNSCKLCSKCLGGLVANRTVILSIERNVH
jgi:hypothetical protein